MRKKLNTRKKFGRICALVVVGMFVVMTSMSISANDPDDWTMWGDNTNGWEVLGTTNLDDLRVVTGGVQRMVVTSGGNVGIGTPLPAATLHVAGGVVIDDFLKVDAGTLYVNNINHRVGIGTGGPTEALDVVGNIHASGELIIGNSIRIDGENDKITATSGTINFGDENLVTSGNVGIGIANPQFTLDVDGDIHATGDLIIGNSIRIHPDETITADGGTIGFDDENLVTTGNVGIGLFPGMPPMNSLDVAGNMAVGDAYAGALPAPLNGMIIEGWVGIGIPVPMEALDVVGNIHANGELIAGPSTAYGAGFIENRDEDTTLSIRQQGLPTTVFVDTVNGLVGIGTTNPNSLLHVSAGDEGDAELILESDTDNNNPDDNPCITFIQEDNFVNAFIAIEGNLERRVWNAFPRAFVIGTEDPDVPAVQFATNDEVRMTIWANGMVGIGTILPDATLDVAGDVVIDDSLTVDANTLHVDNINDRVGIGIANPQFTLDVDGDIHATGEITAGNSITINGTNDKITATSGTINFDDENLVTTGNVGIGILPVSIPMNDLDVAGNVAVGEGFAGMFPAPPNGMIVKGDVGIGTPTPKYKLDVEGYVQAYGYYTGDIIFQKEGEKHWRMFEDEDGLYLENLETGKVYEFVLHEKKK